MAVTTPDIALRSVQFSDSAVFGRVSNVFQAYLERRAAEDIVKDNAPEPVGFAASVRAFFERRRTAAELNRLSDRALSDMGLTRDGIDDALARI